MGEATLLEIMGMNNCSLMFSNKSGLTADMVDMLFDVWYICHKVERTFSLSVGRQHAAQTLKSIYVLRRLETLKQYSLHVRQSLRGGVQPVGFPRVMPNIASQLLTCEWRIAQSRNREYDFPLSTDKS